MAVDDLTLHEAFRQSAALAEIGNGFLRLESVAQGLVDHAEMEKDFSRGQGRGHVAGKGGKQTFAAILVELEKAVAQLAFLAEGQIDARHFKGSGGRA